jgi:DNA repair exonuclease SbcCD nuclease subunit
MILATGDWHLDNKNLVHNLAILNFMDYLEKYMEENGIKDFVFLGDLLNTNNNIKHQTLIPAFNKFHKWKKRGWNLYFIVGNHDIIMTSSNESLIELLSPLGKVIQKPETLEIDRFQYDLIPYTENKNDLLNNSMACFGHFDITDFYYNNYKVSENKYFTKEDFYKYSLVVSGHFHRKQTCDNICYIGDPVQLSFAEIDQTKYFALIDKDSVREVEYDEGPSFLSINIEDFKNYDYNNKIVKVNIKSKIDNFVKLKKILYEAGAIEVVPNFIKTEVEETSKSIDINKGVIFSCEKFLNQIDDEKLNKKILLETFREILKEIA